MDMTVLENTLDRRRYALEDMIAFLEDRMLEDPHVVQMRDEYLEEYEEIAETQRLIDELESELGRWLTPEELTELSKEHSVVGEVLSRIDWDGSYEA